MSENDGVAGHGPSVHLAGASGGRKDPDVFWRRPEPTLTDFEVDTIFRTLWRIQGISFDILRILREEFDGEAEADEP